MWQSRCRSTPPRACRRCCASATASTSWPVVSDGATSSAETVCANVKIIALDSALSGSPDAGYSLVTLDVTEDQAVAIVANPNVTLTAMPSDRRGGQRC